MRINALERPLRAAQRALGLRELSTHQYAHLGQAAQFRLVAGLEPSAPPHVNVRSTSGKG
jgi:hypothetical protein